VFVCICKVMELKVQADLPPDTPIHCKKQQGFWAFSTVLLH